MLTDGRTISDKRITREQKHTVSDILKWKDLLKKGGSEVRKAQKILF